jgi:hypothetical protein
MPPPHTRLHFTLREIIGNVHILADVQVLQMRHLFKLGPIHGGASCYFATGTVRIKRSEHTEIHC